MGDRGVTVYAGPTLPPEDIQDVLPTARLRPPAARGDLYVESWQPGDAAVVLDGYYRDRPSVGHKEILWLLSKGVEVIGAASMGALRAAELAPFGMRGIGEIFRMYTEGTIDGDDEVAIIHGPAAVGYPARTTALVNLRHGCARSVEAGLMSAELADRILRAAKELPFTHRTWEELTAAAGPPARDPLAMLQQRIGAGDWDLKRADALAALRGVSDEAVLPATEWAADEALSAITPPEVLKWRSTRTYGADRQMSDLDVLNAARLFDQDYPLLHEEVLVELLATFADAAGATLPEYAAARLGLSVKPDVALPDELARWLTPDEQDRLPAADQARLLLVRVWPVWKSADWRPAVLQRLRASARWDDWSDTVARADEVAEQTRHRLAVPPPLVRAKLFLRHWQRPGSSADIELSRRGFASMEELGRAVTRFFAYDMQQRRNTAR